MGIFVYNPDDEADVVQYNKREYVLGPAQWTIFEDADAATHAAKTLGMWGVRVIDGKTSAEQEKQVAEADAAYLKATYGWARDLAHAYAERSDKDAKGGLPKTVMSTDERRALDWVEKNAKRLSAAGLI